MRLILGVDPGTVYVGLARLYMKGRQFGRFVETETEVIECHDFGRLLTLVSSRIQELLCKPDFELERVVALEKAVPPAARSVQWELTAQLRGAVRVLALNAGAKVHELTASQVRSALGVTPPTKEAKLLRKINGPAFAESMDARVRRQFCLWSGLDEKLFRGKHGPHKLDALAAAYVTGLREFKAYNERLV